MKKQSGWINLKEDEKKDVFAFADGYMSFLNKVKTEREAVIYIKDVLEKNGFKNIDDVTTLKPGDKVFYINNKKSIYACIIGKEALQNGLNIIGSHIDSPRLDLKPNPVYEDLKQALLKTHYYGGIKKYQWTTIPLCMRGVVVKTNGDVINLNIGEKKDDPIFTITDLLPHLSQKQDELKMSEGVSGENLNVLIGNAAFEDKEGSVKENILKLIKSNYDIDEDDFLSAEIEFVPAFEAKSLGFDKSMVAAYGQDDKACAYPNLMSFLSLKEPLNTCVCVLADKEEIGSIGNTGMVSQTFDYFVEELLLKTENGKDLIRKVYVNSKVLSADVGTAVDPMHKDVSDMHNASIMSCGIELNKYTGSHGKAGSSDANAEFMAYVRKILEDHHISYQVSELGKVDLGGGGTIAYIFADKGMNVVDCGVPLLSMHSPYEVSSKFDLYMGYKTYKYFYEA